MALENKTSRYGQNAGSNTSQISGRLEALAKDVKNLVSIQGQLEGTARDVKNLSQISGKLEGLAKHTMSFTQYARLRVPFCAHNMQLELSVCIFHRP